MVFVTAAHVDGDAALPRKALTGHQEGVEYGSSLFSFFLLAAKHSLASWTKDGHMLGLICFRKEY